MNRPGSLTRRQADVLSFIHRYQDEHGLAPTLNEIGEGLGVNRVTVFEHVKALREKGWIRTRPNLSRAIEVVHTLPGPSARGAAASGGTVPILGRIAAGGPVEAVEDRDLFDIREFFPADRDCYMLRVQGESMIEDQIRDGDLVLVEARDSARPGETVVALIDGEEATLKRFQPMGKQVRLEPRNASMEPIVVDRARLRIQGVVIGVLRRY